MLWGGFPWEVPPAKIGKLLSMGAVARNLTRALNTFGQVVPYISPTSTASSQAHSAALTNFLRSIDILWADLYPHSSPALHVRKKLKLACPALLFAGGAMPKGAEAMLFPWQDLLNKQDQILVTCEADQAVWQQLVQWSTLNTRVIPLSVDETVFYPRGDAERMATTIRSLSF